MRKKIFLALLIIIIAMQFYRPEKNISVETPKTDFLVTNNAPEDVSKTIKGACYDCHSNNTRYPWYYNIAPVSWWMASHIKEGKKHIDFSTWANYSQKEQQKRLEHMAKALEKRWMPLKSYVPMHEDAKLSDEQVKKLTDWIKSLEQ